MTKTEFALMWLQRCEEHLKACDNETCDWYWAYTDFKKKHAKFVEG